jgi:hypothetical protein
LRRRASRSSAPKFARSVGFEIFKRRALTAR